MELLWSRHLPSVCHLRHIALSTAWRPDLRLGEDILRHHSDFVFYELSPDILRVQEHRTEGRHDWRDGKRRMIDCMWNCRIFKFMTVSAIRECLLVIVICKWISYIIVNCNRKVLICLSHEQNVNFFRKLKIYIFMYLWFMPFLCLTSFIYN